MVNNSLIEKPARVVFMRQNTPAAYYAQSMKAIMESYKSHSYYRIISVDPLYREINEELLSENGVNATEIYRKKVFINDVVMWRISEISIVCLAIEYNMYGEVQFRIVYNNFNIERTMFQLNCIMPSYLIIWDQCILIGSVYQPIDYHGIEIKIKGRIKK